MQKQERWLPNKLLAMSDGGEVMDASKALHSETPTHDYLSTACYHGLCERCRKQCKFCSVSCRCACHVKQPETPTEPCKHIHIKCLDLNKYLWKCVECGTKFGGVVAPEESAAQPPASARQSATMDDETRRIDKENAEHRESYRHHPLCSCLPIYPRGEPGHGCCCESLTRNLIIQTKEHPDV